MRKLAIVCISASAAIFLSFYLDPLTAVLLLAIAALLLCGKKERSFLCLLGAVIGCAAFALHWNTTLRPAARLDGTVQNMTVCLIEAPTDGDVSRRLHVRMTEAPGLEMFLYDYSEERQTLRPGELLQVTAKLRYTERNNIHLTGTLRTLEPLGIEHLSLRIAAARCSRLISNRVSALFSGDVAVFMRALMLGEKTDFYRSTALYAKMRGAGFMHIVAVSGMHVAFLIGVIQLLFGAKPASSLAGMALVWFFVFMVGAPPSAVRAGVMQTILLMAPIFRRENDGLTSLALALTLILMINPSDCFSISLQLSFAAMAGMVLLAAPFTRVICDALGMRKDSRLRAPVTILASSLAVLAFSAPLTVLHFGTLALYSPLTNLLGLWAVSLCFCGGWLLLPFGELFVFPVSMLAHYLIFVAGLICRLPYHLLNMQGTEMKLWMALCYVLAVFAWRCKGDNRFRVFLPGTLCILTLAAALWSARLRYNNADAVIAALDVGQGECVCVISGDTTLMLDCGGMGNMDNAGEIASAWLAGAGRSRIDVMVLSHLHADHANGVEMLLELNPVGEIILSPDADADEGMLQEILRAAQLHGTKVSFLAEDAERDYVSIRLRLFAPSPEGSENERCIISLVSIGSYDMLFTGDSLKRAELELTERYELPDTELLIVGHHGSKTSTDPVFLHAIRAEDAIISVGRNNSYGHPTWETLMHLQQAGCSIYRTDRNGTVEVRVKK